MRSLKKSRLWAECNPGLADAVQAAADHDGLSLSALVRRAVMHELSVDANGKPRDEAEEMAARLMAVEAVHVMNQQIEHIRKKWAEDPDQCIGCFIREFVSDVTRAPRGTLEGDVVVAYLYMSGIFTDDGVADGVL